MKNYKKKILSICSILVVLIIGIMFASQSPQDAQEKEVAVAEESVQEPDTLAVEEEPPYESPVDFEELKAINPDIYAWITIPGTNIDYPVLQSGEEKEDDYYLNTTIEGVAGLPGSIYTQKSYNNNNFMDPVTVLYGHTLKDGTMFSELHNYIDSAFFNANPYVYIYLPDKTMKYQIFAAVSFDDRHILYSYDFMQEQEFQRYIDDLKASTTGNVNEAIPVGYGNFVVTLSTCIDEFPEQRLLVNAALLEIEE